MLAETFAAPPSADLCCPITAFGGAGDTVDRRALHGWSAFTEAAFRLRMFPGDHFFVSTAAAELADEIASDLHLAARRPAAQRTGSHDGCMLE
jgi:medium-chain acyl-[acyl-carrier-protein] hydrolase